MSRQSKGPAWWYLLFLYESPNSKHESRLVYMRMLFYGGFVLAYVSVFNVITRPPLISEAATHIGRIVDVHNRARGGILIKLITKNGELNVHYGTSRELEEKLIPFIGKEVKVWTYESRNPAMFPITYLMEIQVGETRLLNNWERSWRIGRSRFTLIPFLAGLLMMIISICRLKSKYIFEGCE